MKRSGTIVSYSAEELAEMRERGESLTDWERVDKLTDADIAAAIASDPDEADLVWDPSTLMKGSPPPPAKEAISLRVDPDVLAFFRKEGAGYQTRINAVLRAYVEAMTRGK